MKQLQNTFGTGELLEESDLNEKVYAICTACSSIYAEFLSWANYKPERISKTIEDADDIIILSCQVTDLAVLNNLITAEKIKKQFPDKRVLISGCLARRFDISFDFLRLDNLKKDKQWIEDTSLINWNVPFWIENFEKSNEGKLFRYNYPLRIGVGCDKKCKYCTIRNTRGDGYIIPTEDLIDEFLHFEDVVLISDSPHVAQVINWCYIALDKQKSISFRNVEPTVALSAKNALLDAAEAGLVNTFHCPIQSTSMEALEDMSRPVKETLTYINYLVPELRKLGVHVATNVIVDYKDFPDPTGLNNTFDSWVWNPYWDGVWNREKAENRWKTYFPWSNI